MEANMQQPQQQLHLVQGQPSLPLGPVPATVTCPSCQKTQTTLVKHESSKKTHLFALLLCATTGCCCIPYCIDSCKNANHYCTNCQAYLGTYKN